MPAPPVLLALLLCSAGPVSAGAASGGETNLDAAAAAVLTRWEAATADRVPVSAADRAALRLARPDVPEELLELSYALRGPIDAKSLTERYDWSLTTFGGGREILMTATPRDPIARAFVDPMIVQTEGGGLPRSLRAYDGPSKRFGWCRCYVLPHTLSLIKNEPNAGSVYEEVILTDAKGLTREEIGRRRALLQARSVLYTEGPDPEPIVDRRAPFRTALFTKPSGERPAWRIERRVKQSPPTQLTTDRAPLTAPRPR